MQHWSRQWCSWLRIPWATLPEWFVTSGLRFIPKRPVWGWLAGCHGACLLAQGKILGPAGKVYILFCFCLTFGNTSPFPSAQPDVTCKSVCLSCLFQGDMELALESYDVCVGLLQSKPKTPEGKPYTISLPNLRVDAAISVEEVSALANQSFFFYQYNPYYQHIIIANC